MKNPFSLEGKTVLVTGASSGIGRAAAVACAGIGARLVITGRNEKKLSDTLSDLEGDGHICIKGDLTVEKDIETIVSSIPKIDGVVHCAGIGKRIPCKAISPEDVDLVMETNFKSSVMLQSALLANRKINRSASIVFITSFAASAPSIGNALYSASKGAMISYAKCLALELAPRGIRVNCISPAMIWTDLIFSDSDVTREQLEEREKNYMLGRYGKPEDVANLAIYLLSDASSWMTCNEIEITGGGINEKL